MNNWMDLIPVPYVYLSPVRKYFKQICMRNKTWIMDWHFSKLARVFWYTGCCCTMIISSWLNTVTAEGTKGRIRLPGVFRDYRWKLAICSLFSFFSQFLCILPVFKWRYILYIQQNAQHRTNFCCWESFGINLDDTSTPPLLIKAFLGWHRDVHGTEPSNTRQDPKDPVPGRKGFCEMETKMCAST